MTTLSEQYFGAYLQRATNSTSNISTISNIPREVPLETLIALATFRPEIIPGGIVQKYGQNFPILQSKITQELISSSEQSLDRLKNYKPQVLPTNAIQRRKINGVIVPENPRDRILRGIDPKIKRLVEQLDDLRALTELTNRLTKLTRKLEDQINKFTSLFNALINLPDAAASAALTILIDKLDSLEQAYTRAKAALELVIKTAQAVKKAILKALFQDIPKAKETLKKGLDVLGRILKLREIPRIIRFPKFPKLPTFNFTKANFFAKYKKALETLKKKDGEFYQKAYKKAVEQAGFEIVDPKKDKIQRGLTQARNSLREARANLQTRQAIRSEAVNRARNDLIQQTRNISSQVLREQQNAITQYQNTRTRAQNRVSQARQTLTNVQQRSLGTINQGLATVRSVDSAISSAQNLASTLNSRQLGLQLASELTNQLSVGQ